MMGKRQSNQRHQVENVSIDELVPQDHLLRKIDQVVDFDFIYDLVRPLYAANQGRPGLDPVLLIKLPIIQYLFGISSMRQTIQEIRVNLAYRWFLGLSMTDVVPHFTTFGKNFEHRFKGTDVFEQIFREILEQCQQANLIDSSTIFVDGTHVKAHANGRKANYQTVTQATVDYRQALDQEIQKDRLAHDQKPLKPRSTKPKPQVIKVSPNDPESGWFHKGDHRQVFAYSVQAACDRYGWVLDYTINADAGYRTPAIAHELLQNQIMPIFPYQRPRSKRGTLPKSKFVYDEYYDCYLCPRDQVLSYVTTTRQGYRVYQSDSQVREQCPLLPQCTTAKNHRKVLSRHLWAGDLETAEAARETVQYQGLYELRKVTIEPVFGTAKTQHGLRATNQLGQEKLALKAGLTFACHNMKKLAKLCG